VFALESQARLWSVAGHLPRKLSPAQDRIDLPSQASHIDSLHSLSASIALIADSALAADAVRVCCRFFKLVRYFSSMRFAAPALHAEARTLSPVLVIPDRRGGWCLLRCFSPSRRTFMPRKVRHHSASDVVGV